MQNFNTALEIAKLIFQNHHPINSLPNWLNNYVTLGGTKTDQNEWRIRYTAVPFAPLAPNQAWEEIRGNKVVVETDLLTGKRSILISRAGPEAIVLFEVLIGNDLATSKVVVDCDFSTLRETDFSCG